MKNKRIRELVEHLILYSASDMEPGLYNGKMGICVCLSLCANYFQDEIYTVLSGELLDDLLGELTTSLPANFAEGLCGIGWGVEFLLQSGCLSGNSDDILEDIDMQVMQIDISRVTDLSVPNGLGGIAYYVYTRLTSHERTPDTYMPFDEVYLQQWQKVVRRILQTSVLIPEETDVFNKLGSIFIEKPYIQKRKVIFPAFLLSPQIDIAMYVDSYDSIPKGLYGGLAGMIIKTMYRFQ